MKVGIISDTHGHVALVRQAAAWFIQEGVQAVIHCGAIGTESVLTELAEAFDPVGIPVHAVTGNMDVHHENITQFPATASLRMHGRHADLDLDGHRIYIMHGDEHARLNMVVLSQRYDYVFHGHTHEHSDKQVGRTRMINPGAFRSAPPTVALLDLATNRLVLHHLK